MPLTIMQPGMLLLASQATLSQAAAEARLFQNDHRPTPTDLITDYVECDFDGYVGPLLIAWGIAVYDGDNAVKNLGGTLLWRRTVGVNSNLVYGIYFLDMDGDVTFAERFAAPRSLSHVDDYVEFFPEIRFSV